MEDPIQPKAANASVEKQAKEEFSGTEGIYLLPHYKEEIERLQRQNAFIKAATNGELTNVKLPTGARVLDAGCADGAWEIFNSCSPSSNTHTTDFSHIGTWLADLAGFEHASVSTRIDLSLHGADLGSALFRKDSRLDLREHDLRTPFPESWGWKNSFDLVHQRLLVWGIGANEWPTVLKNLADAVKPGGTLQLVEAEWILSSYTDEQVQQKKLAQVQRWSTESSGMDVEIWRKFPHLLKPLGFRDIKEETFNLGYGATSKRPEDRTWTAELLPQSFRHLARKMPSKRSQD